VIGEKINGTRRWVREAVLARDVAFIHKTYVKGPIDDVAGDGGFVLAPGAVVDHAKPENMHAMIGSFRKCGVC